MALLELVLGIRVGLKLLAPAIWNRVSGLGLPEAELDK